MGPGGEPIGSALCQPHVNPRKEDRLLAACTTNCGFARATELHFKTKSASTGIRSSKVKLMTRCNGTSRASLTFPWANYQRTLFSKRGSNVRARTVRDYHSAHHRRVGSSRLSLNQASEEGEARHFHCSRAPARRLLRLRRHRRNAGSPLLAKDRPVLTKKLEVIKHNLSFTWSAPGGPSRYSAAISRFEQVTCTTERGV